MVEYEYFRVQLIGILHILADMNRQQEIWGEGRYPPDSSESFDIAMHFILDDTALADMPSGEIGRILKDDVEAQLVGDVTRPILELYEEIGGTHPPHIYIENPRWLEVAQAAKKALEVVK